MSGRLKTGLVVQMRLDSTRLPGKALLPLAGTTLAGAVMRRLSALDVDERVLATDRDGALALGPAAREAGFQVFAGPKDDVLGRFALAVEAFGLGMVVRATGDNPFVSVPLAALALSLALERGSDYVGLIGMPTGMGVEAVRAEALLRAASETRETYDREHVCPYLYNHPDRFRIDRPECPAAWLLPEGRVTIDTRADYDRALALVAALGTEPDDGAVMAWLRAESAR